jgi:GMP synthase (glutamine-hydrolysing)
MANSCVALRHVAFEDLGELGPLLAGRDYDVTYCDAGIDTVEAQTLLGADLVVVLGGPIGVYEKDAYPFLDGEIAAVAARLQSNKPILGICLGAQLMAAALGARVAPGPVKEIGYAPLSLTAEGAASALAPLGATPVLHWHGDNCELPKDCLKLAATPHCPVQAFQRLPSQLALQFHLEIVPDRFEAWLVGHAVELGKAGIDPRQLRRELQAHGATCRDLGRQIFGAWLDGAVS